MDAEVDLAVSLRMEIHHGAVQPLETLLGGVRKRPVVPFFINSVAPPFAQVSRLRKLGAAVGGYLATLDQRVFLIGSGGLLHEPPALSWVGVYEVTSRYYRAIPEFIAGFSVTTADPAPTTVTSTHG